MKTILRIFAVFLLSASVVSAQSQNAADIYRLAARNVPRAASDAEKHVWIDELDAPLDSVTDDILRRGAVALERFDTASQLQFGNWGFNESDPLYPGQIVSGLPDLTNLVQLRARQRGAAKQYAAAMDDCYNLLLLSRRLSVQPSLVRQIQQTTILIEAIATVATMLPELPPAEVRRLFERTDALRSPIDPLEVAALDKQSYLWVHHKLVDDATVRRLTSRSGETLNEMFGINTEPIDVFDLVLHPDLAEKAFAETENAFDEMMVALKKPPAERELALRRVMEKHQNAHLLVRNAIKLVYQSHQQSEMQAVMLDMFRTAAAICVDQPPPINDEAARQRAGRYEYIPTPSGFELRFRMHGENSPLVLQVGPRPVRARPTTGPTAP